MLMGAQYKEGRKKILAAFSKTVSPSFHVTLFASLRRVSRLSIMCRPCPLYLCVCVCQCTDGRQTGAPMLHTRISSFKITISVILRLSRCRFLIHVPELDAGKLRIGVATLLGIAGL